MKTAADSTYQKPEPMISKILRSGGFSMPIVNPQKTALIKRFAEEMPPISYVSRPQLKLAGERFNPKNYTAISNFYFNKISYMDMVTKKEKPISFPAGSVIRETLWSPDGKSLAVSLEKEWCQEVWVVAIPSLKKTKISGVCLSAALARTVEWLTPSQLFLAVRTKNQAKPIGMEKETPTGPVIQQSDGVVSQNRTYPDLIKTAQDEKVFAQAAESQLVIYNLKTKKIKKVGKPALFSRTRISPNKKWLLVETFLTPFSKSVPHPYFKKQTAIWNFSSKVKINFEARGPFESLPIQGVPMGPRSIQWIESEPETLCYVEALDQGDWEVKVDFRDELFRMEISENKKPKPESIYKFKNRFAGIKPLECEKSYWILDYERDQEWVTTLLLEKKSNHAWDAKTIFSLNVNDSYGDPGEPVSTRNQFGRSVIAIAEPKSGQRTIFLAGNGASVAGDQPFLTQFNLDTFEKEELFKSQKGSYEIFAGFMDKTYTRFITQYQSQKESPRFYIRTAKSSRQELLYADQNPYEIFSKIKKEIITYKRKDGVALSGTLYYPLNYKEGKKYPAIIQAYPLEYTDASTAGQVRGSQDKFSCPFREDMIYNTLRGYFLLDEAQMPIIGHPETKNDTFIDQLVAGAKAAVDTLVERGLVDSKRIGIVGHSYGGFMVANLLTHSDLFATGIAKSGAYNRSLTPFGFQGERRPLWRAKEIYSKLSPFLFTEQMKAPILLIHGMVDNNPGTFPIQSERYYEALKGQGVNAKLVLLPEESHGYAAIESIEHTLFEIFNWFDTYLSLPGTT